VTRRECFAVLADRYLAEAREAETAGRLREAYRCIRAAVYCARQAEQ
jgi:hypothetical protein